MAYSMTGFGRGEAASESRGFVAEIRSVNHRFFDCGVKLPRGLAKLEDRVRQAVSARIARGKADVFITCEDIGGRARKATADMELAAAYVETAGALRERFGLEGGLSADTLLRLPDILKIEEAAPDEDADWAVLSEAVGAALDGLSAMRAREGERLTADIRQKLSAIAALLTDVEARAPLLPGEYRARLEARLKELLGEGRSPVDENRLAAEVLIFADRCAIDEELVRLKSHMAQMESCLASPGPVGRKLDFIVQEINREVNTIGSKANDALIGGHVVDMKSEVEKIREQVQNLE